MKKPQDAESAEATEVVKDKFAAKLKDKPKSPYTADCFDIVTTVIKERTPKGQLVRRSVTTGKLNAKGLEVKAKELAASKG